MIGILGGMGTQAGLDFCNKIAVLNRGKKDQQYPKFIWAHQNLLLLVGKKACQIQMRKKC